MTLEAQSIPERAALDLEGLVRQLTAVLADVRGPRSRIEGAFSEMGGSLVSAAGLLRTVSEALDEISRSLEGTAGEAYRDQLQDIKTRAHTIVTRPERRIVEIPDITKRTRSLGGPLSSLKDTINAIALVAVPLRIAATDFSDTDTSFDVFTSEVVRLANEAANAVAEFTKTYQALIARLEAASASSEALSAKNVEAARVVSARIESSLANVAAGAGRMATARREIEQRFRDIQASLGTAVSAIQFGDIARQRIEHIEEGLALGISTLRELKASVSISDAELAKRAGFLCAVVQLQSDQTRDTMRAFDEGAGALVSLLNKLAADAAGIVGESEIIRAVVVETSQTVQKDVGADLSAVVGLLAETENQRKVLDEALQSVVTTMSTLFEQLGPLRDMRSGVHLLSVNMALRCSQLGAKGRSIRAIAQELSELSSSTVTQVSAVIGLLQDATSRASSLVGGSAAGDDLEAEVSAVRSALAEAQDHSALKGLENEFAGLRRSGVEIASLIQGAVLRAKIQPEIVSALNGAHLTLRDLREGLLVATPVSTRDELKEHERAALEELRNSYTMMSERLVHDQALGAQSGAAAVQSSETLDDILF